MLLIGLAVTTAGCTQTGGSSLDRPDDVVTSAGVNDRATLVGAGSTFAAPLVEEWVRQYRRVAPNVAIDYQGSGSPRGVEQLATGAVDFAVSELTLADVDTGTAERRAPPIEVPCVAGGVAIVYNLPGVVSLRLSATTLAAIFAGRVTKWDDDSIRQDNHGLALPSNDIRVLHRSDPSGTTQVLTQYLRTNAPDVWTLDTGPVASWAHGTPAEGSEALTAAVEQTVGAIGYTSAHHAARAAVGTALLENRAGSFVGPTPESVHAAVSRINPEAPGAYPVSTVSFLLFASTGPDDVKTAALRHFAAWVLTEGQRSAERLGYASVPDPFLSKALSTVLGSGQDEEGQGPTGPGG